MAMSMQRLWTSQSRRLSQLWQTRKPIGQTFSTTCKTCSKTTSVRRMQKVDRTNFNEMGYILLVVPGAAFCLGTWQVKRRRWKLDLIEQLEKKTVAEPVDFPDDIGELQGLEYRKVKLRGQFDHSQELYIMPRSPISLDRENQGGLVRGGSTPIGVHVVTPFQLADRNMRILINRGWVSRENTNPNTRKKGQIEGEVELVGVVRLTEKRPQFAARNNPGRNQWYHRDLSAMAAVANAEPICLDADKNSTVPGGPVGGQTRVSLRNEHLSYIFTWYSLAVITSLMWHRRYWRIAK